MSLPIGSFSADATGWLCLGVGIFILVAGVIIGLRVSLAKDKLEEAGKRINEAMRHIGRAKVATADAGPESAAGAAAVTTAADDATASAEAAQTALEQVQGIIGSLPENLRFPALLVLVGTVLIGVATVQFGGTSLF